MVAFGLESFSFIEGSLKCPIRALIALLSRTEKMKYQVPTFFLLEKRRRGVYLAVFGQDTNELERKREREKKRVREYYYS